MSFSRSATSSCYALLKQTEVYKPIHQLRRLTDSTQIQLVEAGCVICAILNPWKNRLIQLPVSNQICTLIDELSHSFLEMLQVDSQRLPIQISYRKG